MLKVKREKGTWRCFFVVTRRACRSDQTHPVSSQRLHGIILSERVVIVMGVQAESSPYPLDTSGLKNRYLDPLCS